MSEANHLTMNGFSEAPGGVYGQVSICGFGEIDGDLCCDAFLCAGNGEIDGDLSAGSVQSSGHLEVEGDLEAEQVKLTGSTELRGLLNAEVVNIAAEARSEIVSIGGSVITVRYACRPNDWADGSDRRNKGKQGFFRFFSAYSVSGLEVDTIEGDTVDLENTTAQVVRGYRVTIGQNCSIERVEYTGYLDAKPGTVKNAVKV